MTTQNEREIDAACHCPIVFVVNFPVFVPCFDGFLKACSRLYFYDYKENKEPSSVKIVLVSHYPAKCNCFQCICMIYCPKAIDGLQAMYTA